MEKVKLPKEVAEAIEELRKLKYNNYGIIVGIMFNLKLKDEVAKSFSALRRFVDRTKIKYEDNKKTYERINEDVLIEALVNGWEIVDTFGDDVREWYQELQYLLEKSDTTITLERRKNVERELATISKTLDLLGVKVSGVNEWGKA